jgi:predicted RNase H-like HicB family nuclease
VNKYKMIIYAMETGEGLDYIAEYPALKGVVGIGLSEAEALVNLQVNAQINVQALKEAGLPIPDSDITEKNEYSGKLSVRLSSRLHRSIAELSSSEGVSINHCIVEAVSMYITERNYDSNIIGRIEELLNQSYFHKIEIEYEGSRTDMTMPKFEIKQNMDLYSTKTNKEKVYA